MERNTWMSCFLVLVYIFVQESQAEFENANQLLGDLFRDYTPKLRPRIDFTQSVDVEIDFTMTSISNLDEVEQVLYVNGYISTYWRDDFLTWNTSEYGGIEHIVLPAEDVWLPDIGIANSVGDFLDSNFVDFRISLHNDGRIAWTFGGVFATSCSLDLTFFPFDRQKCEIIIENWAYIREDVDLVNGTTGIVIQDWSPNGIWHYVDSSVKVSYFNHDVHVVQEYPKITFTMFLSRKSAYYMNSIIYPCIMLLVVALVVFWLPPDSGEKIGLGITVALAFSVFQIVINDITPATSDYSPVLGTFVLYISGLTAFSTFISVLVLHIHHKSNKTQVPQKMRVFLFRYVAAALCMRALMPNCSNDIEDNDEPQQNNEVIVDTINDNDCDKKKIGNDEMLEKLSSIDLNLKIMKQYIKDKEQDDLVMDDWKAIASLIDRLCFWIVLLCSVVGTAVFLTKEDDSFD